MLRNIIIAICFNLYSMTNFDMRYVRKRMSSLAPGLVPVWIANHPNFLHNVTTQAKSTFTGPSGDQNKYQLHNTQCVASCSNNVSYHQSFFIHAVTTLLVLHVVVVEGLHLRLSSKLLISAPFDDLFMGNEISDCLPPCSKFLTQTKLLTQQVTSSYVKLV